LNAQAARDVEENLETRPLSEGVAQLLPGPALEQALENKGVKTQGIADWRIKNENADKKTRLALAAGSSAEEVEWVGDLLRKSAARIRLSVNPETAQEGVYNQLRDRYGRERLEIVSVPGLITAGKNMEVLHAKKFMEDITQTRERLVVYVRTDRGASIDDPESLKGLQGVRLVFFNIITKSIMTVPDNIGVGELIQDAQLIAQNA
jgi:hypothetical protein